MATHSVPPNLVVIDTKTLRYSRFEGKKCINIVIAEEPLLAEEVELYRTKPQEILPDPLPPEVA